MYLLLKFYVALMFTGVYGALEVLYAGVVAEIPCKENKHRLVMSHCCI